MARIDDFRRVFLSLSFIFLIASLIGAQFPWLQVSQSGKNAHAIYLSHTQNPSQANCTAIELDKLSFTVSVYFSLLRSQVCQDFTAGTLPEYVGGAKLKGVRMCTDVDFDAVGNFMKEEKTWQTYANGCSSAGAFAFVMEIFSIVILCVSIFINTFPKSVHRCCADQKSRKNRVTRMTIAIFAPLFPFFGLLTYSVQCVNGDLGSVLSDENMDRTGYSGYWLSCIAVSLLIIWFVMFAIKLCGNKVEVGSVGFDFRTGFLNDHKTGPKASVDQGMLSVSEEEREAVVNRTQSAYDDDDEYDDEYDEDEHVENTNTTIDDTQNSGRPIARAGSFVDAIE